MTNFSARFEASFGNTDKARTAAIKIRNLSQGNRPAAFYASEFLQLASDLEWDNPALMEQFRFGLRGDVKDLMLSFVDPVDLEVAPTVGTTGPAISPLPRLPPGPTNDPMHLDAVRFRSLTNEEKERRRRNNLCLYCGGTGHIVRNCPVKLRISAVGAPQSSENGQTQLQ
jgi:hypothetical protein